MRSKSAAERPKPEAQAPGCAAGAGLLQLPAALSLVRGAEPRPAGMTKPGLY
ncbi:MAG: hypothetical protein JO276_16795 [Sphingomonadaceae bacterium]|nr:hypothetical protein [Sphingomonadaceae bacterium]